MMKDNDWLKDLGAKMKDYEEPAPKGLWEDIESSVLHEKKRRLIVPPVFWRVTAAAAVVALGVFDGLRLSHKSDSPLDASREILASDQPSSSVISEGGRESSVEVLTSSDKSVLLADNHESRRSVPAKVARNEGLKTAASSSCMVESTAPELLNLSETDTVVAPEETTVVTEPEKTEEIVASAGTGHEGEDWSDYLSATNDDGKITVRTAALDMSFSGASTGVRNESAYDLQMFYRGSAPTSSSGLMGDSNAPEDGAQIHTRSKAPMNAMHNSTTVISKSDHKRPLRIAMMVNYPVSRVLGLETGVALTTLHSTFSNEVGNTFSQTEQTLRYVGVPLNMTASVLDSKWISLYAGAGGMVEKCVSGKSVTTEMMSGVKQGESVSQKMNIKPLLWSLNVSAGMQVNCSKNIGFYIEPGLSYHFDDRSDVQTIYKEHPLDFMLTFGARFSLK